MAKEDKTFDINVVGENTKEKWIGTFKCKTSLSFRDQLLRDRIRRDQLGEEKGEVGLRAKEIAIIQSEIRPRLTKMPTWFSESDYGLDLEDDNVLYEIYAEVMKAEEESKAERDKDAKSAEKSLKEERAKDEKDK